MSEKYKKSHGLLTAKELQDKINKLGIDEEYLAYHLKTSKQHLLDLENGEIQSNQEDELLRQALTVGNTILE